jgi:hypothetical protein
LLGHSKLSTIARAQLLNKKFAHFVESEIISNIVLQLFIKNYHYCMQLQQLVYQSSATVAITPYELQQLLPTWREHNHADDISGVLLYGDAGIMQVLEGPPAEVHRVYQRIASDPRHYDVCILADGLVPTRAFGQWSMGFVQLDAPDLSQITGYVRAAQPNSLLPNQPQAWPELIELLQEFVLREQQPI